MLFKVFKRKLFGKGFEKFLKYIIICIAVFFGLRMAEINITIAPFIKYLMSGTFTAGIMWHSLSTENFAELSGIAMLPFKKHSFTFSYISAYGLYTLITKSALLISVISAVSMPVLTEVIGIIICTLNGVLVTSAVFVTKKHRVISLIWAALSVGAIFTEYALILLFANLVISFAILITANPYNFTNSISSGAVIKKTHRHSVWKYLFRYMTAHKNYLINTAAMWAVGVVLPYFMKDIGGNTFLPMGFSILSINTPLCVLISADRSLRESIHFLPSGTRMFCLPYFSFIVINNLLSYTFYLVSFSLQTGGFDATNIPMAIVFALLGAFGSVFMEIKFPLKDYKTESDLWHHPRKYVVPAALLLIAGVICAV